MRFLLYVLVFFQISCSTTEEKQPWSISHLFDESPSITGKQAYLNSPYVTAGDQLYMVGNQDGTFPEIGWHIKGEMGGIWNHPIKLMDGFDVELLLDKNIITLDSAQTFINYPFANEHRYNFSNQNLEVSRIQYVLDHKEGLFVQYTLQNNSDTTMSIDFKFTGHIDLRPTWLGEETGMIDGEDEASFDTERNAWTASDQDNPWFAIFGADRKTIRQATGKSRYQGKGTSATSVHSITISPNTSETIKFVIAGSYTSVVNAQQTYKDIHENYSAFAKAKKQRYAQLAKQSKLTIPDKDIQEAFEWLKYNSDWLIQTVPEIGTGITAGIPDYPWWFGVDSEYALQGYMMVGQTEPVYQTIALLDSVSNALNGNGRIMHEMSTNGKVFNLGNINETPQFASLIWKIYQWDGDKDFLKRYFPTIEKGLDWLLKEKDANKNGFPDGFGMMEIHGLDSEMIDVAVYTQKAFDDASKIAGVLEKDSLSRKYATLAQQLKDDINREFWSEEFQSYADFIGTDEQALHLIEDAIVRADTLSKPWAVEELKTTRQKIQDNPSDTPRPFVLHHNWVVNTPMETKIAPPDRAKLALQTAQKFVNPFGVFVTGIDRDESAGNDSGSFKGSKQFSYTGAVMTLPTAVQIIAENNYGNPDQALNYLKRMTRSFSYALPGSMYEVSPDYGMITQAWNIYGYAIPIVEQFFGIHPDAGDKSITIQPQMPSTWEKASLENVKIGDIEISVYYSKNEDGKEEIQVKKSDDSWTINVINKN